MKVERLIPILNVSNIQESFAWFEKLGWQKGWDYPQITQIKGKRKQGGKQKRGASYRRVLGRYVSFQCNLRNLRTGQC